MISKVAGSAFHAIQRGTDNLKRTAQDIAVQSTSKPTSTTDVARSMVGLRQNQQHTAANIEVLKAADKMLGALLDEKA